MVNLPNIVENIIKNFIVGVVGEIIVKKYDKIGENIIKNLQK